MLYGFFYELKLQFAIHITGISPLKNLSLSPSIWISLHFVFPQQLSWLVLTSKKYFLKFFCKNCLNRFVENYCFWKIERDLKPLQHAFILFLISSQPHKRMAIPFSQPLCTFFFGHLYLLHGGVVPTYWHAYGEIDSISSCTQISVHVCVCVLSVDVYFLFECVFYPTCACIFLPCSASACLSVKIAEPSKVAVVTKIRTPEPINTPSLTT